MRRLLKLETRTLVWGALLAALLLSGALRVIFTHQMIHSGLQEWNMAVNTDMWRFHHAASFILDYANIDGHPDDRETLYAQPRPTQGDVGWYDDRGRCVQSPVFNYVLAGVYKLTAPVLRARGQVLAVVLLNHAMGLLTIVLVFLFTRRVWSGKVAAVTALLMALHVPLIFLSGFVLRTSLGVFLLAAWLLQVARAVERPTLARWAACGVLAALAGLMRENLLLLGPYAALLAFLLTRQTWHWQRRIAASAIAVGSFLITCAPVSVYNTWRAGEFVFVRRMPEVVWRHANSAVSWRLDGTFPTGFIGDWKHPALPVTSGAFWKLQVHKSQLLITNDHVANAAPWRLFAEFCPILRFRPVRFGHLFVFGCAGVFALLFWDRRGLWVLPLAGILAAGIVLLGPASRYRVILVPLLAAVGSAGLIATWLRARTMRSRIVYLVLVIALVATQGFAQLSRTPKAQDWYVLARLKQRQGDLRAALDSCQRANEIGRTPATFFLEKELRKQLEQSSD